MCLSLISTCIIIETKPLKFCSININKHDEKRLLTFNMMKHTITGISEKEEVSFINYNNITQHTLKLDPCNYLLYIKFLINYLASAFPGCVSKANPGVHRLHFALRPIRFHVQHGQISINCYSPRLLRRLGPIRLCMEHG